MEDGYKKDSIEIEIKRVELAIRDLESHPTLSTGGILLMRFVKFMLKKKHVQYPIKWLRWLRENAAYLSVVDQRDLVAYMDDEEPHGTQFEILKLTVPSRPSVPNGISVSLKWVPDSGPGPHFEVYSGASDRPLIGIMVGTMFEPHEDTSLDDHPDLKGVASTFGDINSLLWICMLISAYDFDLNSIILKKYHHFMLGDCDALVRLKHECWLDSF